jgi:tetratricopeptide (TPR) repeat protein
MTVLLFLMLLFNPGDGGGLYRTARINKAKDLAEKAFKQKNYKEALKYYSILTDSFKVSEETVLLNKSHCYFNLNDKAKAKESYNNLSHAANKTISSIANQQLGNLAFEEKNLDLAKNYFKSALKAHPENNEARYNYELVSRLLKKQDENEKKNQDKKDNKEEPPQEPSLFAKKLKEQAESLAGSYKYSDAYNLMMDGVKKDKSVLYYKEFIDKLKVVADLSKI